VVINSTGEKETTPASTTTCQPIPVTVAPMTDILLDIEASASPVALDGTLAYTLTVTNNAPDSGPGLTATGLVVSSTLDSRLNFQYATTNDGNCTRAGHVVTCQLDTLAATETAVIRIGTSLNNEVVVGDRLEHQAGYRLNQPNQADNPLAFATTTVVAPADFIVNTIADEPDSDTADTVCRTADGRCSLRAAIEQANAQAGLQTIALDYQRYWLDEDLEITDDMHLTGLGADNSLLAGKGGSRVLLVQNEAQVTLTHLAIMGGQAGSEQGGGLYNVDGTVSLDGVLVSQNQADSGGGIWNGGTLTLVNSAVTGNQAADGGGGIHNEGTATLANVTLSGNTAVNGGGLSSLGSATLTNVTVSHNQASSSGGGLQCSLNSLTLNNTILAGNTAVAAGPNCDAGFTSQGHNLIDDTTNCSGTGQTTTDIYNTEARLRPLNQNNSHTPTVALAGGSPAIDAGSCLMATDQRGILRPVDGNLDGNPVCDIGAFEFTPLPIYLPLLSR
jgi:CSLREA domain-containing protein